VYLYIGVGIQKNISLPVKTFKYFISLHTYKMQRVTENEKEKVSCIAVSVKCAFSQQEVVQRNLAKATKNLGAGVGAYLAGFLRVFVCTI